MYADTTFTYVPITIPMRDGHYLAADLYYSDSSTVASPVILIQTPYNKNYYRLGTIPSQAGGNYFPMDTAYHYVISDWRGFYGSTSAYVPGYNRGLDGYDSVEWIATQAFCNGKVGTWGTSALGYIQYQTAEQRPPHLVCCVPQAEDYLVQYEKYYYGGDYRIEQETNEAELGLIDTTLILAHPDDDIYWQYVQNSTNIASSFNVPMLLVSGWYDLYPNDNLRAFNDICAQSDTTVRQEHRLIFGPWTHFGIGDAQEGVLTYNNATSLNQQTIQFWDYYMKGISNGWDSQPVVSYYQMGEDQWLTATSWSGVSRTSVDFYLQPGGGLSQTIPSVSNSSDSFLYDPNNPTPAWGGARFNPFDTTVLIGPQDLSTTVENRLDVLVYSTPVLSQDLRVNGHVFVQLYVSSNQLDTDFGIRLTDVYPDGSSLIMTQGVQRMRFRNSYSTETLMTLGQIYSVIVGLQDLALTFQAGHQIRVDVCSADYPYVDKNLNNGGPMYVGGTAYVATNAIYHDSTHLSKISLQVIPTATSTDLAELYVDE